MKVHKSKKRRHAGKLKRLTMADRYRKRERDERTGRLQRRWERTKVIPGEGSNQKKG